MKSYTYEECHRYYVDVLGYTDEDVVEAYAIAGIQGLVENLFIDEKEEMDNYVKRPDVA